LHPCGFALKITENTGVIHMKLHVLPGDSLVERFTKLELEGEPIVCRECLTDGELPAGSLEEFWDVRKNYLAAGDPSAENFYENKVRAEFERLLAEASGGEINLWFEYELFCQVNLWFCLWLLQEKSADLFVVYPVIKDRNDVWNGFAFLDESDLRESFEQRRKLELNDVVLGARLFEAFRDRDFEKLESLGKTESRAFPKLKEVTEAAAAIETRPKETLRAIIEGGETDFGEVFRRFSETEKVYGFGDRQVKKIFDELRG
jgi:hypothetical protein